MDRHGFMNRLLRLKRWVRRAFLWLSKHAVSDYEAAHYFWLAMWNGKPYSWSRMQKCWEIAGRPLDLKRWR
jgi:hypothetical protein